MSYSSLCVCVNDLEKYGYLVWIKMELDLNLEIVEVYWWVFDVKGLVLFFEWVKGSFF